MLFWSLLVVTAAPAGMRPFLASGTSIQTLGELAIVLPVTSRDKRIRTHVRVSPPERGLKVTSFVKCEDVRSISTSRMLERRGSATADTMEAVEDRLRILLQL